jgi:hypothetical protein
VVQFAIETELPSHSYSFTFLLSKVITHKEVGRELIHIYSNQNYQQRRAKQREKIYYH